MTDRRDAPIVGRADGGILDEPLLDAEQVSALLGIPKASVYEYARDGRLPCVCIGRHRKFVRRDLAEAVSRMREVVP
jgi:excisionase family DNA binding protein